MPVVSKKAVRTKDRHGAQTVSSAPRLDAHELELQCETLHGRLAALEAAHDRYRTLFDFAPFGYLTLDHAGLITAINVSGLMMLGHASDRIINSAFGDHIVPADQEVWRRHLAGLAQDSSAGHIELTMHNGHGRSFVVWLETQRDWSPGQSPILRIALLDVSERQRRDTELRLAATAFESQTAIMITDAAGVIERVNAAFTRTTGYTGDEVAGRGVGLLHSGRHDAAFYREMWDTLTHTGAWQGQVWDLRKNGESYPALLNITAIRDAAGDVVHYVGAMHEISQRFAEDEEIARLAYHDPLTGLPNRRLLRDRLQQAFAGSARSGRDGAVLFIDLDHFKLVNDNFGHRHGDLLLQEVARRLSRSLREVDTVARLGGDEFVVMMAADLSAVPRVAAGQAQRAAQKLLAVLNEPYFIGGEPRTVGASIGVALFNAQRDSVDTVLDCSDAAMYEAKLAGRNTVRVFDWS